MLEEFYQDKLNAHGSLSQSLARLSPSASFSFAATRLAGTGAAFSQRFHQSEERFRESGSEYMDKLYSGVSWTNTGPEVSDPKWFNADDLPRFEMAEESFADSLNEAAFDVLLLVLFNAVFMMGSYLFFLRYDVT